MKKIIFTLIISLFYLISFSQKSAEVIYKARLDLNYHFKGQDETTLMYKKGREMMEKQNELLNDLTYKLEFNNNESIYKWNKIIQDETVLDFDMSMAISIGGDGLYYRNIKQRYLLQAFEFENNEKVRMTIPYNKIKWKITNETSTYLGHKIIKAVSGKYHVAWFAPDIPVPFGPSQYGGLPGLILKYNYRAKWIEAIEIKWKKEPIKINRPTEGELKTEQELLEYYRSK